MKSEEKNKIIEMLPNWTWSISESESEAGLFCPRCGEPIPMVKQNIDIDDEVRKEQE